MLNIHCRLFLYILIFRLSALIIDLFNFCQFHTLSTLSVIYSVSMLTGTRAPCCPFRLFLLSLQSLTHEFHLTGSMKNFTKILVRIALNIKIDMKDTIFLSIIDLFPFMQALFFSIPFTSLPSLVDSFCYQYWSAYWWLLNYRKKRKGYEDDDYVSKKPKHEEVCSPKVNFKLFLLCNLVWWYC